MKQTKKKGEMLRVLGIIAVLILFGLMALLNALSDQRRSMASMNQEQEVYSEKM